MMPERDIQPSMQNPVHALFKPAFYKSPRLSRCEDEEAGK